MTNFIFKSQGTYKKLCQQLEIVLAEQRCQRRDLAVIIREILSVKNSLNLQKQVDEYFDETSHQTDSDDKEPD